MPPRALAAGEEQAPPTVLKEKWSHEVGRRGEGWQPAWPKLQC